MNHKREAFLVLVLVLLLFFGLSGCTKYTTPGTGEPDQKYEFSVSGEGDIDVSGHTGSDSIWADIFDWDTTDLGCASNNDGFKCWIYSWFE